MNNSDFKKYYKYIYENKLDKATNFRRSKMPKYIYKFYPLYTEKGFGKIDKRTFGALKSNQVWCSKIEFFNDPYEGIGYYYPFDKDVEIRLANCLRICSFTENAVDNISMWAYYTNNHKGFCVKYEVVNHSYLYDVNYIEERLSLSDVWLNAMSKHRRGLPTDKEQLLIYEKYLTKHISWKNEKEYRIIFATNDYDEKGRLIKCEDIGLKAVKIYSGLKCTKLNENRLMKISKQIGCGEIGKTRINENKFILIDD